MKKNILAGVLLALTVALLVVGCGRSASRPQEGARSPQREITVSAAVSLKDALEAIKEQYTRKHPEVKISYNFGASGLLQKQIEQGAPVDLFISAGVSQMDRLAEKGLIEPESRTNLLSNELVLVTPKNGPALKDFHDLAGSAVKRIAIGLPDTVPAGQYARESLTNLKLWDILQPKLVMANDVRQVLTFVETGNADAGFVYRSDVMRNNNVQVSLVVPDNLHKPIIYPAAVVKNAPHREEARNFLDFLASPEGMLIFEKYGLRPGH
ncbi:molybdate ABC transporter substrate-binding protein [Desulfofundulus sp.]|uniref:molybdate ABC transporter substrate-binding protein n=1 Tax=Desulfofundulus sp. TaxID=2282750 RepID=UPI003C750453